MGKLRDWKERRLRLVYPCKTGYHCLRNSEHSALLTADDKSA